MRYTTFHHVYKQRWRDILRFRARSLFTTCEVCCAFKAQLQDRSLSFEQKLGCLQGYRAHLHDQYCDRTVIWTLQSEGCDPQAQILMLCTDGLDQAKFQLPRDPQLCTNAGLILGLLMTLSCGFWIKLKWIQPFLTWYIFIWYGFQLFWYGLGNSDPNKFVSPAIASLIPGRSIRGLG